MGANWPPGELPPSGILPVPRPYVFCGLAAAHSCRASAPYCLSCSPAFSPLASPFRHFFQLVTSHVIHIQTIKLIYAYPKIALLCSRSLLEDGTTGINHLQIKRNGSLIKNLDCLSTRTSKENIQSLLKQKELIGSTDQIKRSEIAQSVLSLQSTEGG